MSPAYTLLGLICLSFISNVRTFNTEKLFKETFGRCLRNEPDSIYAPYAAHMILFRDDSSLEVVQKVSVILSKQHPQHAGEIHFTDLAKVYFMSNVTMDMLETLDRLAGEREFRVYR